MVGECVYKILLSETVLLEYIIVVLFELCLVFVHFCHPLKYSSDLYSKRKGMVTLNTYRLECSVANSLFGTHIRKTEDADQLVSVRDSSVSERGSTVKSLRKSLTIYIYRKRHKYAFLIKISAS